MKLCECGCGEAAPLATQTRVDRGFVKGQPQRFIKGHSNIRDGVRKADRQRHTCACGCGDLAPVGAQYIHGHNRRSTPYVIDSNGYPQTRLVPERFASMKDAGGYVMVHRLVVASNIGRPLTSEEVVHHINEDRTDFAVENLQLLTRSEHMELHRNKAVMQS